jgi:hypothetical protein
MNMNFQSLQVLHEIFFLFLQLVLVLSDFSTLHGTSATIDDDR